MDNEQIISNEEKQYVLATYRYPQDLLPLYHSAVYQLIVGVEQDHSNQQLQIYARNLRHYAKKAFCDFNPDYKSI